MRVRTREIRKKEAELDATGLELFAPLCDKIPCNKQSTDKEDKQKNTARCKNNYRKLKNMCAM